MDLLQLLQKNQPIVAEALQARRIIIRQMVAPLLEEDKSIEELLAALKIQPDLSETVKRENKTSADDKYNLEATLMDKVVYLVSIAGQPLSTSVLADKIIERQPDLERKSVSRNLSAVISTDQKRAKRLKRSTNSRGEFIYTLSEINKPAGENTAGLNEIKLTDNKATSDGALLSLTYPSVDTAVR